MSTLTSECAWRIEKRSDVFRFEKPRAGAATEPNMGEARVVADSPIPHNHLSVDFSCTPELCCYTRAVTSNKEKKDTDERATQISQEIRSIHDPHFRAPAVKIISKTSNPKSGVGIEKIVFINNDHKTCVVTSSDGGLFTLSSSSK